MQYTIKKKKNSFLEIILKFLYDVSTWKTENLKRVGTHHWHKALFGA